MGTFCAAQGAPLNGNGTEDQNGGGTCVYVRLIHFAVQ